MPTYRAGPFWNRLTSTCGASGSTFTGGSTPATFISPATKSR